MKLTFSPVRGEAPYSLSVSGDVLSIDGEDFDFGPLQEGDVLPASAVPCKWIIGEVTRQNGAVCLQLLLPHGPNAPDETRYPAPIEVTSGTIELPPFDLRAAPEDDQ